MHVNCFFPRIKSLNQNQCFDLVRFIGKEIGADINTEAIDDNWPIASISKKYDEGISYGVVTFISNARDSYWGMGIISNVSFRTTRNLAEKLHSDIQNSYKKFFE